MRTFTREELSKYDGKDGRAAYVSYMGKVYDVSHSFHWKKGIHQVMHRAGHDLTKDFKGAPHSPELLDKFPMVGELKPE